MIHIGLFEGIGGFSFAASNMGWKTLVTCEINPFGQRVLKYYWPHAYHHDDIKTLNYGTINNELSNRFGAGWRNDDIIITGGFPCQPYSLAGKRLGTADDRHLWPEMLRIIREVQPTWVVGENVFGLINWNGGLVFDEVQTDLEAEGYEVQPYVLPAASVNAPHKRDRVWFVAYRANTGTKKVQQRRENGICRHRTAPDSCLHGLKLLGFTESRPTQGESKRDIKERERIWDYIGGTCQQGVTSNTESQQSERMRFNYRESCQPKQWELRGGCCEGITESNVTYSDSRRQSSKKHREKESGWITEKSLPNDWENFPTQSPVCIGDDGLSSRLVSITFPKWRNESIKAMGNAIVPRVVLEIFKSIEKHNKSMSAYTYPGLITPEKIITVICDMLHVTEAELRGDKRRQAMVDARRITVKEIRRRTKVPYADIGRLLNKHHASMMYMEKSYDELLANHAPFRIKAKHVEKKLNEYFTPNN